MGLITIKNVLMYIHKFEWILIWTPPSVLLVEHLELSAASWTVEFSSNVRHRVKTCRGNMKKALCLLKINRWVLMFQELFSKWTEKPQQLPPLLWGPNLYYDKVHSDIGGLCQWFLRFQTNVASLKVKRGSTLAGKHWCKTSITLMEK